jgi:imidazolonepropionase-like amidohydrolase
MNKFFTLLLCTFFTFVSIAQQTFPQNGVFDEKEKIYAFTNATIYVDYKTKLENATLLIKKGKVISVSSNIPPKNAVIINCATKYIYPGFIELISEAGLPKDKKTIEQNEKVNPQFLSEKKGAFAWNEAIKPEIEAVQQYSYNSIDAEILHKMGFTSVLSHFRDGIMRGTGVMVNLNNEKENLNIIVEKAAQFFSFSKGSSKQDYPNSLMGVIALIRQTFYDAIWYKKNNQKVENNLSLQALNENLNLPQIIETNDYLDIFRAKKLSDEFNINFIYKSNGTEYKAIEALKKINPKLIIGINFPLPYDVEDIYKSSKISYAEMLNWENQLFNLSVLEKNNIDFSLSSNDLLEKEKFLPNLRKAVKYGLSEQMAIKSLTYNPANFLNIYDKVGSLEQNKFANFIIVSNSIFNKDAVIESVWSSGVVNYVYQNNMPDKAKKYVLEIGSKTYFMQFNDAFPPKLIVKENEIDSTSLKCSYTFENNLISISIQNKNKQFIRLSGVFENEIWSGTGQDEQGNSIQWKTDKIGIYDKKINAEINPIQSINQLPQPAMAYGLLEKPLQQSVLIKNAIIWTNEKEGILQDNDLLIQNGKIAAIGKNLVANVSTVIDAAHKHVTSGIIDEHSHIAISRGVNEGTQASSAEVSIADVLNPNDINIYRQLAGGVTTSQLLHGSANPIGGQSAIIKLRWGANADGLLFENAPKFIKFALGENVKQSNWGDKNTIRFPQTRMGVEQVYYDYFERAKSYSTSTKERRDLELEILQEILEGKRFITCHSYVQSEINMLMKVADSMNFKVNTFTHILEGYKLADKIKKHGANVSTFSDWWDYKFEVYEAIPYNAALMQKMNLNVGINSDDAEMGRRLNQEAAKAVKYGNISEAEALKMVTLNPAKMLHIDNRVGSIKIGKDADIVIWSDNPLSIYAKVEQTYIDGIKYFDIKQDKWWQEHLKIERNRLIQKMLDAKNNGESTQNAEDNKEKLYHCDDIECEVN